MEVANFTRDSFGLIPGIQYTQGVDGLIDWRRMITPELLVVNKGVFEKNQQPVPTSIEGLADNKLLILLAGIKKLARLRGYSKIEYSLTAPSDKFVAVVCRIEWLPNFETEGRSIVSSGIGDAHEQNTDGFGRVYLSAIAENRAFVRCVRNFLGINIIGQDEVNTASPKPTEENGETAAPTNPAIILEKLLAEKHVTFEELKAKLIVEQVDGAANFQSLADIPRVKIFELMERLKRKPKSQ